MPEYKVCAARLEPAVRLASVTDVLVMAGEEK
jgi:hypothetical protein